MEKHREAEFVASHQQQLLSYDEQERLKQQQRLEQSKHFAREQKEQLEVRAAAKLLDTHVCYFWPLQRYLDEYVDQLQAEMEEGRQIAVQAQRDAEEEQKKEQARRDKARQLNEGVLSVVAMRCPHPQLKACGRAEMKQANQRLQAIREKERQKELEEEAMHEVTPVQKGLVEWPTEMSTLFTALCGRERKRTSST